MSVRTPAWNNSAPNVRSLMKYDIWAFFVNLSRKIVSLESVKNNVYFTWYLVRFFIEWEIFQTNVVDKIVTYFIFNNLFPNIVSFMRYGKYGVARRVSYDKIIRHMRFPGRVTKAAFTYSEYAIIRSFPPQQLLGERASMFHFRDFAHLLYFNYVWKWNSVDSFYCVLMKCNQTTMNSVVDKPCVRTVFVFIWISLKAFDIIH